MSVTSLDRVILGSLPVGERVGIAFSGGLDTCCALAWMREHGAIPYAFTADLGQYDEPDIAAVPARALQYGAEEAVLVDCREPLAREGLAALQCGAFHIQTAGKPYFNTTPLGRAVTGTLLVRAMADTRRRHLGRRLDVQGQRHRALLPVRAAREPEPAHLQAVARPGLRRRARRPHGDERVARCARSRPRHLDREKAYSTDANLLGATHEAKDLELLETGMKIVEPIMGVAHWDAGVEIEPEVVTIRFERGMPVGNPVEVIRELKSRSAGGTAWACAIRSRTGSSKPRAAASTRRRGWPCCTSPTSAS